MLLKLLSTKISYPDETSEKEEYLWLFKNSIYNKV